MGSEEIVDIIIDDLRNRKGLAATWEDIDPGTQLEIRDSWVSLVEAVIDRQA